jgi:N-acetylglutamate synthase-like GNAT family acetyltransferase
MRPEDLPAVLALLARFNIAPLAPTPEIPDPERTEVVIGNAFVAAASGRIVGVTSFIERSPTVGEGASLAVEPEFRKRGIAEQLILAGRREMHRRGIRTLHTETDRPEWFLERWPCRVVGTVPKRHAFGRSDVGYWTILEIDLATLPGVADTGR